MIFIGTVNGKEYNSIADFNKAIAEVLKSGEPLQADSKCYEEDKPTEKLNAPFPYITLTDATDETGPKIDLDFMNKFTEIYKEDGEFNIRDVVERFPDKLQNVTAYLKLIENNPMELFEYLKRLDFILVRLEETDASIDDRIGKMTEMLKKAERNLKRLNNRRELNTFIYNLYTNIFRVADAQRARHAINRIETAAESPEVKSALNELEKSINEYQAGSIGECEDPKCKCCESNKKEGEKNEERKLSPEVEKLVGAAMGLVNLFGLKVDKDEATKMIMDELREIYQ